MSAAILIVLLVLAAAASGAVFKPGPWYETLKRPDWTPPNWAFPLVWSLLYVATGISGWLVWTTAGVSLAMGLWLLQLIFNAAWSWLFFGLKRMDLALVDVCMLLVTIVTYIVAASAVSAIAALLFVPYALWVATAAMLNRAVWRLNPGASAH